MKNRVLMLPLINKEYFLYFSIFSQKKNAIKNSFKQKYCKNCKITRWTGKRVITTTIWYHLDEGWRMLYSCVLHYQRSILPSVQLPPNCSTESPKIKSAQRQQWSTFFKAINTNQYKPHFIKIHLTSLNPIDPHSTPMNQIISDKTNYQPIQL